MSNVRFNVHSSENDNDEYNVYQESIIFFDNSPSMDISPTRRYSNIDFKSSYNTEYKLNNTEYKLNNNITFNDFYNFARLSELTSLLTPVLETYYINESINNQQLREALQNSESDQELKRSVNVIVNINSQLYNTTDKKFDNCSICTEEYKDTDMVSVLNCGHIFHPKCIKEWGHYNPSCPVCKEEIPVMKQ